MSAQEVESSSLQKFSFEPLRRHYGFLTFTKPHIADDFVLSCVLLTSLHDFAGRLVPSLAWSSTPWLNLTLYSLLSIPGMESMKTQHQNKRYSEYDLPPVRWQVYGSARAYY